MACGPPGHHDGVEVVWLRHHFFEMMFFCSVSATSFALSSWERDISSVALSEASSIFFAKAANYSVAEVSTEVSFPRVNLPSSPAN